MSTLGEALMTIQNSSAAAAMTARSAAPEAAVVHERPILFSAPMIRAVLAGIKTQTRRAIARGNSYFDGSSVSAALWAGLDWTSSEIFADPGPSPAGNPGPYLHVPYPEWETRHRVYPRTQPGDRLWVRENGWERPERTPRMMRAGADTWPRYAYDADGWSADDLADFKRWGFKRRSLIHMPRWASRITLDVVEVRVERLQEISAADAVAEGISEFVGGWICREATNDRPMQAGATPQDGYRHLWESINGSGSWGANPWVWIVTFARLP